MVMRSPEGQDLPCRGVYLEVAPKEALVFTDAYEAAWEPSDKSFMTALLTFADDGEGRTKYTARVRHCTAADRAQLEALGSREGRARWAAQHERRRRRVGGNTN